MNFWEIMHTARFAWLGTARAKTARANVPWKGVETLNNSTVFMLKRKGLRTAPKLA